MLEGYWDSPLHCPVCGEFLALAGEAGAEFGRCACEQAETEQNERLAEEERAREREEKNEQRRMHPEDS